MIQYHNIIENNDDKKIRELIYIHFSSLLCSSSFQNNFQNKIYSIYCVTVSSLAHIHMALRPEKQVFFITSGFLTSSSWWWCNQSVRARFTTMLVCSGPRQTYITWVCTLNLDTLITLIAPELHFGEQSQGRLGIINNASRIARMKYAGGDKGEVQ